MKIKGIELEKIIEEKSTIYRCPYCNKKFINKNSIDYLTIIPMEDEK